MSELFNVPQGGDCIISDDVITTITISAALEVAGVASMAPRGVKLGNGKPEKAVKVTTENDEITLDVHLNLYAHCRIPDVCSQVQKCVKNEVQDMTGKPVTKINVHVDGVVFENGAEAAAPSENAE